MLQTSIKVLLATAAATTLALFAGCGSSSSGTGGAATTTTGATTSGTTSASTTSSTSMGTGGSTTTGDAGDCKTNCINNNPTAAQKFEGYELKECGCASGSPCNSQCTAECADPTTLNQSSPCGMCLLTEASKGTSSTCTAKAGLSDCEPDPSCAPFLTCALACP